MMTLFITILRMLIIHYYVDWRFLWGGDQVPLLNFDKFMESVYKLELPWRYLGVLFIPQQSLVMLGGALTKLLSLGIQGLESNVPGWITNSILFLLGLIVLWYAFSAFEFKNPLHQYVGFALLALFYTFNPWSTIDTFKSYLDVTSIVNAFFFALTSYYLIVLKYAIKSDRGLPSTSDMLISAAIAATLASISPASAVRLFIYTIVLAVITAVTTILVKKRSLLTIAVMFLPTIIVSLVLLFFMCSGYIVPLEGRVLALWDSLNPPKSALYPSYASIINDFIGMNTWVAHSGYMPYHELYEKGVIAGLMLLWPLISLGGALLLSVKRLVGYVSRAQISALLLMSMFLLAWGTALNEPFGLLKNMIVSRVPIIVKAFPWSYSIAFIGYVYLMLVSYVLSFLILETLKHIKDNIGHNNYTKTAKTLVHIFGVLTVSACLLATALPIFNGQVFGQYFNENIKGFNIPKDYNYVKDINTRFYEHILLLPETPTYTSTRWGWQGSIAWYYNLNPAILTYTSAPYIEYTNWSRLYSELVHPSLRLEGNPVNIVKYVDVRRVSAWNSRIIKAEHLPNGYILIVTTLGTEDNHTDIILPFSKQLDISGYKWLQIRLNISGPPITISPWVFIYSGEFGGAHIFPSTELPANITKVYVVGLPDEPWPASKYDPRYLTGLTIRINLAPSVVKSEVILKIYLKVNVGNNATLCKEFMNLLELLNVRYIVMDRYLSTYNTFYQQLEEVLSNSFKVVYNGSGIKVYEVDSINSQPLHIISPKNADVHFEHISPYLLKADITLSSPSKDLLIALPILYQKGLPNPFNIKALDDKGDLLNVSYVNYHGLLAAKIELNEANSIKLVVSYSSEFIVLYISWLIMDLAPGLLLLIVAFTRLVKQYG